MSLLNTETVDIVLRRVGSAGLDLLVVDSGDVTDERRRYELLTRKLRVYLAFIVSGQYRANAPDVVAHEIGIRVICTTEPTEAMRRVTSVFMSDDQQLRVPVVFETEQEFRYRMDLSPPTAVRRDPWWRFW